MINDTIRYYWYWLSNVPGIGPVKIRKLLDCFETPEQIYKADEKLICSIDILSLKDRKNLIASRNDSSLYERYFKMLSDGINMVVFGDDNYPKKLLEIYDAPPCIYYKGELPKNGPSVAIVGSRACSSYGREMAKRFGRTLSKAGINVISGLATGIDAYGHMGALEGGGRTYAVMGCGVDICYPAMNQKLYEQIIGQGGVLSEYPPGTSPSPGQFPMRNRIISGLSDIVIVVEARKKSGSLITVDQALEQNREVMVVPGRITDVTSEGCNNLIKLGATMVTEPEEIILSLKKIMPDDSKKENKNENKKIFNLAPEEEMVYSGLDFTPKSLEEIVSLCDASPSDVVSILMRLIMKGAVKETARNFYVRLE